MPSCFNSFWHGLIPTSYFIFNDFYTCIYRARHDSAYSHFFSYYTEGIIIVTPTKILYVFEEGVPGSDLCVKITTNDDSGCPIHFQISVTLNIIQVLGNVGIEYSHKQIEFEPCQNTSCVNARELLDIPLEDDGGIHLNLIYNYSLVEEVLELGSGYPAENVKVDNTTGTIVFIDDDGT